MQFDWDNLSDAIFHYAQTQPDAPAIHQGGTTLSYRELASLIGKATVYLHDLGVKRRELVGISLPTNADHVILVFALMRIGAFPVDVPMNRPSRQDPFKQFGLTRVFTVPGVPRTPGMSLHIIGADWRTSIENRNGDFRYAGPPDETFHFILTSGSTGGPKGALTTQRQWNNRFRSAMALFPDVITTEHPPNLLVIGEMSFSAFFFFLANQFYVGGPVVLIGVSANYADLIKAINDWEDTAFLIAPPLCRELLNHAPATGLLFPRVRAMFVGAAPLFAEEKRAATKKLTPNFYEVYGNASSGCMSSLCPAELAEKADSVGRIAPGITVEIVDRNGHRLPADSVGHVRCQGPGVSQGYYGMGARNEVDMEGFRDGWYYPADIGVIDDAGYVHLKGRVSDLIMRRGVEIFAPEIEEVLGLHPSVSEAAVIGLPGSGPNNEVFAVVAPGGDDERRQDIRQHCRKHLPPEKIPDQIFAVESLPKTGTGKIDRAALKSVVLNKLASEAPTSRH